MFTLSTINYINLDYSLINMVTATDAFSPFMPQSNEEHINFFPKMMSNLTPGKLDFNAMSTNTYDVTALFGTQNIGINKQPDGSTEYITLINDLESYSHHPSDALVHKLAMDFHMMIQYVGLVSQGLLVEYSKALDDYDFQKALLILTHIYAENNNYKLPLMFETSKTFLVSELKLKIIECEPSDQKKTILCELFKVLLNTNSKLNVLDCDNTVFKFPSLNLLNSNYLHNSMPIIILPKCLIDTSLLLTTSYITDCILVDCLGSLGVSKVTQALIKKMLISANPTTVVIGKIAIVAATYEAIFSFSNQHGTHITSAASGLLVEKLYKCVVKKPGEVVASEDSIWISLIEKMWFGMLNQAV
ncbi:hypothetical protein CDIK_1696 [Cucumispora dikerogammari]|nr:hypothetical protein CDIK_1696 [Cucumispora dikerogammari]